MMELWHMFLSASPTYPSTSIDFFTYFSATSSPLSLVCVVRTDSSVCLALAYCRQSRNWRWVPRSVFMTENKTTVVPLYIPIIRIYFGAFHNDIKSVNLIFLALIHAKLYVWLFISRLNITTTKVYRSVLTLKHIAAKRNFNSLLLEIGSHSSANPMQYINSNVRAHIRIMVEQTTNWD